MVKTERMTPMIDYSSCSLCPRECGSDRKNSFGFCRCGDKIKVARAALHFWEEPCISGKNGSGTVFFSGCTLRCCYCQNYRISSGCFGKEVSAERLSEIFLKLQEKGAHNINLVTPTQYLPGILTALDAVKGKLHIPVVYNCGGYEKVEAIKLLKGYVDIFLPDLKYFDSELSHRYSGAADYFSVASAAIIEMIAQTGEPVFDKDGILQKGVIIRHMVLPGGRNDSIKILNWMKANLPEGKYLLSLMSQYTPAFESFRHKEINRRVTSFEYDCVTQKAEKLGLTTGFMQERSSAKEEYTPPFDLEGV
jgi:putative pyruvate formate lyase activating enzyme